MARKGLGRGLEAILGDVAPLPEVQASKKEGVKLIPLGNIKPDPTQPRKRFVDEEIEELAASIRAQGLLQPILVRPAEIPEQYIIIAGERRWKASAKAGLHDIPVLIRNADPIAVAEMALIENLQRANLNPIEEADAYAVMRDQLGRKPIDIAEAVGKSRSHVANMLRLVVLPISVREKVIFGTLTMGHARALLTASRPEKLADIIVKKGLSVREAEKLAAVSADKTTLSKNTQQTTKPSVSHGSKDADTKSLERDLEAVLGLSVAIEHGKKGGNVTLTYDTLDQLDDICRRLMGTIV